MPGPIHTFQLPPDSNAFDIEALSNLIKAHGVHMVHYRAMRNPVGMVDIYDSRRPGDDYIHASNGMYYVKAGCVQSLLIGNSKALRSIDGGILDASTAQMTPDNHYQCEDGSVGDLVYLHPGDRLFYADESILVPHQQLVETHATGRDRLKYPAVQVQDLVDAQGTFYQIWRDFDLVDGQIVWKPGRSPKSASVSINRGAVYSIRYLYRPYWYVERLLHEIRIAQYYNPYTGERETKRLPQSAIVQREYVYQQEAAEPDSSDANPISRQQAAPRDGGFGPR